MGALTKQFSDGFRSAFSCSNTNAVVHGQDEYFTIADLPLLAGLRRRQYGIYRRFDKVIIDGNLQLHFAKQIDRNLMPALSTRLAFLPTEALAVEHS